MKIFDLGEYRYLFRDNEAFEDFVGVLRERTSESLTPVVIEQEVIGALLSSEATEKALMNRMLNKQE